MLRSDAQFWEVEGDDPALSLSLGRFKLVDNHADGGGVVRDRVYQDEGAGLLVRLVGVEEKFAGGRNAHLTYLVQLQMVGFEVLHRINVHLIFDGANLGTGRVRRLLDVELFRAVHRLLVHPDEHRLEVAAREGPVVRVYKHLATGDINLVLKRQRNALRGESLVELAVVGNNALHARSFSRRQGHDRIALADNTARHLAGEATEILVRAQNVLHRVTEIGVVAVQVDGHRLKEVEERRTGVPRRTLALFHHVIAVEGGKGDAHHVADAQRTDEAHIFIDYRVKYLLVETDEVHLIDRQDNMMDTEEGDEERVAACLGDDTRASVHEDDGKVGRRAAGNHVAGILLVPRRVGDDKLAVVGREVAVSHVDGDALLALGLETVEEEGVVNMVARITHTLAVALEGNQLVFVEFLAVEKQSTDQGRFTVIDGAGGEEAEQVLLLIFIEKSLYI